MGILFDPLDRLTPRQLQIMRRTYRGDTTVEMSADLQICLRTLRWHAYRIRKVFPTFRLRAPVSRNHLTPRERQIARLVAAGLSNRAIGEHLHLSPVTVSWYLNRLYHKTGSTNRVQLALTVLIVENRIAIGATEAA